MTDLFDNDQTVEVTFDALVGEGKKFKSADDLARAKIEADRFIEQLKKEADEARTELRSRLSLEELSEQLLSRTVQPNPGTPPQEADRRQDDPPANPIDLKAELQKLLQEEKTKASREQNIAEARKALKDRFGGDYNATLRQIAEELGVSDKFLADTAATSPVAFLKLVDSVKAPDPNRPLAPPQGHVDTSKQFNPQSVKNNAYYQRLRKEDPKRYFSKQIQRELYEEAMRQGSKFFE